MCFNIGIFEVYINAGLENPAYRAFVVPVNGYKICVPPGGIRSVIFLISLLKNKEFPEIFNLAVA